MGNEANKKFTWVIKNFSSLESMFIDSDQFVIGGCKWYLKAYPEDLLKTQAKHLSLFLEVADFRTLPCGWKRHTKYRLTVVNQLWDKLSQVKEIQQWFEQKTHLRGKRFPLTQLHEKYGGFLVNNEVKIVVEIDVLEVVGKLDVPKESEAETQPQKKRKLEDTSSVDVNGFHVLPSQVKSVKRIFEKHPNMASNFRAQDHLLRTLCINALLNLIQTLCKSLQVLSIDDLGQADNTLTYLKNSGFKVDWLERKLEKVKEKKIEEEICDTRIQELEEEVKGFKQKYSDIEVLLEKKKEELKDLKKKCVDTESLLKQEKTKVLAARAPPLTLDDVL